MKDKKIPVAAIEICKFGANCAHNALDNVLFLKRVATFELEPIIDVDRRSIKATPIRSEQQWRR